MKKLILAATLCAQPALAHHGWSEYDQERSLKLTGKVLEPGYEHPHGHIRLETPGKTWRVVLAPPSRMQARGLPPEAIKAGPTATVEAYATATSPTRRAPSASPPPARRVELR